MRCNPSPAFRLAALAALAGAAPLAAQPQAARVDAVFSFATSSTPGCAVAAVRNGEVLYARGYGMADLENRVPITPETAFYLASVSKQFTAAAVHLLVLDGKLSLDDDVRKHVPELPAYAAPITIRHLLHHTSGLRDYLDLFGLAGLGDFAISNRDFLAMLARQRGLNFRTGERYSYTNSGYVLLSIVVERVSGKSLRAFAAERIFAPLGMSATLFRDDRNLLVSHRASAYRPLSAGAWALAVPYFDVVGDGGLFSTVLDLARWEANFWQPRVGGPAWLALTGDRGKLNDGRTINYGAGLQHLSYRGDSIVEHGGGYGGYNTYLMRFPRRRFSVAVLCNSRTQPSGQLAQRVADVFLGDSLARVAAAAQNGAPAAPAAGAGREQGRYTGTFFSQEPLLVRAVVEENGRLYYRRAPGNRSELKPLGGIRFEMLGTPIVLVFSARADTLRLEQSPDPPVVLARVRDTGLPALSSYAGSYASAELGTTYTVAVSDSVLTFKPERGGTDRVGPVFVDAFSNGYYFVRFLRDARRRVVGMELSAGDRVRYLRFDRRP